MDTSKQKPDLMGKSGAPADGVKRILAHLEHGAKIPASKTARVGAWSFDGWTLGLAMMLLGMFCIAWLLHDGGKQSSGFKQGHGSSAARYEERHATVAVEPAPSALASADLSRQTPGALVEQPAAIINDAATQVDAGLNARMHAARDAGLTNAFGLPVSKIAAAAHARSGTSGAVVDGMAGGATHADRRAVYPGMVATNSNANHPTAASSGATSAGARNRASVAPARSPALTVYASAPGKAPAANDTDVALLTALVAHAGKPTVVMPERSRDIVERYDGDNTADLLARCKQLGVIEGMLCRSRICSGRWDSDPVCRAPAQ